MKKIKIFFAILLSVICFPLIFSGCNSNPTGNYKVDVNCEVRESNEDSVYCTIKVYLPNASNDAEYKMTFTLNVYGNGLIVAKKRIKRSFSAYNKYDKHKYLFSLDMPIDNSIDADNYTATLTSIVIEEADSKPNYTPYAIGFGATAGAILVGAIVVFVLEKKVFCKKS